MNWYEQRIRTGSRITGQVVQIPRKQGGFPHVLRGDEPRHHPLQPDGKSPLRRHPMPEGFEVARKRRGLHAARCQGHHIDLVAVQPLAADDHRQPPEEQVVGVGQPGPLGIGVGVSGALCPRIAHDEQPRGPAFAPNPLSQQSLVGGRQVLLVFEIPPVTAAISSWASSK
jgi:hypothetical protein